MGTGVAITSRLARAAACRESDRAAPRDTATASLSDEELARRAQQGCVDSFEQLMRRFQVPVLHFLRRRGGAKRKTCFKRLSFGLMRTCSDTDRGGVLPRGFSRSPDG